MLILAHLYSPTLQLYLSVGSSSSSSSCSSSSMKRRYYLALNTNMTLLVFILLFIIKYRQRQRRFTVSSLCCANDRLIFYCQSAKSVIPTLHIFITHVFAFDNRRHAISFSLFPRSPSLSLSPTLRCCKCATIKHARKRIISLE